MEKRGKTNKKPPAMVANFRALDADIGTFVTEKSVAESTREQHASWWRTWTHHCADLRVDPTDAPWAAWQELENLRRLDGRPYAGDSLPGQILASVEWHYATQGIQSVPAPRRPEHLLDWEALGLEWRKRVRAARARSERATLKATEVELRRHIPMLREDALALVAAPIDGSSWPRHRRRASFAQERAEVLAALDTGLSATVLWRVSLSDIAAPDEGNVLFAGHEVPCDHRERVRGVPWDCSACAVRELKRLRATDAPETRFAATSPGAGRQRMRRMHHHWRRCLDIQQVASKTKMTLVPRHDLTEREQAGLRRGLVVREAGPKSAAWLAGRAWVGVSWAAGFRMIDDLTELPRSAARELLGGEPGIRLTLDGTKTDQAGRRQVSRPFTFAAQPTITAAFVEYLTVRDAAFGDDPEGPLLIRTLDSEHPMPIAAPGDVSLEWLARLAAAADLDKHFTSYSTRKGYTAQAEADGWELQRTQAGLRHVRAETTHKNYRRKSPRKAIVKFQAAVEQEGVA